ARLALAVSLNRVAVGPIQGAALLDRRRLLRGDVHQGRGRAARDGGVTLDLLAQTERLHAEVVRPVRDAAAPRDAVGLARDTTTCGVQLLQLEDGLPLVALAVRL